MRFVATKTPEQQSCLMLHRTRHLFIRQQTAVINAIRAHLAEFGIIAPVGRKGVEELLDVVANPSDKRVPEVARACLVALGAQLRRFSLDEDAHVGVISQVERKYLGERLDRVCRIEGSIGFIELCDPYLHASPSQAFGRILLALGSSRGAKHEISGLARYLSRHRTGVYRARSRMDRMDEQLAHSRPHRPFRPPHR